MQGRRRTPWAVLSVLGAVAVAAAVLGSATGPPAAPAPAGPSGASGVAAFGSGYPLVASVRLTAADDPGWRSGPPAPLPASERAWVGACLGRPLPSVRLWVRSPTFASPDGLYRLSTTTSLAAAPSAASRQLAWAADPEYPVCQAAATRRAELPSLPPGAEVLSVSVATGPPPAGVPRADGRTVTTTEVEAPPSGPHTTTRTVQVVVGRGPLVATLTVVRRHGRPNPARLRLWTRTLWHRLARAAADPRAHRLAGGTVVAGA